jgi:enduracididine biosynthesis enzyme MppP
MGVGRPHNLTELEILAVDADVNVADGHPRQQLTPSQAAVVGRIPEMFEVAAATSFEALEARAHRAFMDAVGQYRAPVGTGRMLSCYASSVGIDVVARCLSERARNVALIHPTFDNIPDLLKAWSVQLVPLEESDLDIRGVERIAADDLDCLWLTTPNNPSGCVVDEARLRHIAEFCAVRDLVLVLDTSFRGFDRRAQYDTYALLDEIGGEYVVIEDTGKLWPTLELKLGIVVYSPRNRLRLERAMSDVLLSVSPVVLQLVEGFATDAANGGFAQLHGHIADNRCRLREALGNLDAVRVVDNGTRISVERIEIVNGHAPQLWRELSARGVHVLPCGPFHWARPSDGESYLRVALGREPETIERAVSEIRRSMEKHSQSRATLTKPALL